MTGSAATIETGDGTILGRLTARMTNVERVEKWYEAHERKLTPQCSILRIKTLKPRDEVHSKVVIEVETESTLASVTFWNQGDVTVLNVEKATGRESILDDRRLTVADNIESLLDGYFQQIVGPEVHS